MPSNHLLRRIANTPEEKRGLILAAVFFVLIIVGVAAIIAGCIVWKRKRDRRNGAKMQSSNARSLSPNAAVRTKGRGKTKYRKLDDEEEREGIWSADVEMERGRSGYVDREGGSMEQSGRTPLTDTYR